MDHLYYDLMTGLSEYWERLIDSPPAMIAVGTCLTVCLIGLSSAVSMTRRLE